MYMQEPPPAHSFYSHSRSYTKEESPWGPPSTLRRTSQSLSQRRPQTIPSSYTSPRATPPSYPSPWAIPPFYPSPRAIPPSHSDPPKPSYEPYARYQTYGNTDHYSDDQVPLHAKAESASHRSRARRASRSHQPQLPTPKRPSISTPKATPRATEEDARRAGIPSGYSIKNWDPNEEPIMLLGSVFDAASLDKSIYDLMVLHDPLMAILLASPQTPNHSRNLKRHYEIHGTLANTPVAAFPDTGSGRNVMSLAFADENKLRIDNSTQFDFLLPSGKITRSVGSVKVPWKFAGESSLFDVVFSVLPKCTRPVILGKDFLKFTETLTKFTHRIKSKLRAFAAPKSVHLLGPQNERVLGTLDGRPVAAVPDTGSDVMLMSRAYAERYNLTIVEDQSLRSVLEFANGSRTLTSGMVTDLEWTFANSDTAFRCDFLVMDDLMVDVVLSNDFLFDTKAFQLYAPCFYEEGASIPDLGYELSLVKQISWLGNSFRRLLKKTTATESEPYNDQPSEFRKELQRRDDAEEAIASLPQSEQLAAQLMEKRRRDTWQRSRQPPGRIRVVGNSVPSTPP